MFLCVRARMTWVGDLALVRRRFIRVFSTWSVVCAVEARDSGYASVHT